MQTRNNSVQGPRSGETTEQYFKRLQEENREWGPGQFCKVAVPSVVPVRRSSLTDSLKKELPRDFEAKQAQVPQPVS